MLFYLIIVLLLVILVGVPVAIALGATTTFIFIIERGIENIPYLMIGQRVIAGANNFVLLAIPFFILAGKIMNESGVTSRIFRFANNAVGSLNGGLGHVNIVASMLFAGKSGSAVSDAAGLGTMIMKAMTDEGYDKNASAAITGASSVVGPVIPPSIPMVMYGVLSGVSVGSLFIAGILPGLCIGLVLMGVTYLYTTKKYNFPKGIKFNLRMLIISFLEAIIPLFTIVILIGGIWSGIFTPTEAAVVAVVYALFIGVVIYKTINFKKFFAILHSTLRDTSLIMFIIAAANLFGWIVVRMRIPMIMAENIMELTTSPIAVLLILNVFLLVVGCFLETNSAINILTPILVPLILEIGIDPLHFGIVMIINLMIGLLTPPMGMVLYTITSVTDVKYYDLQKAIIPYILALLVLLVILTLFPSISTWLPSLL